MFPQLSRKVDRCRKATPERSDVLKRILAFFYFLVVSGSAIAQLVPPQSVATTDDVFAITTNPAGLAMNQGFQFGYLNDFASDDFNFSTFYLSDSRRNAATGLSFYRQNFSDDNPFHYRFVSSNAIRRGLYLGYGIDFGKAMAPMYDIGLTFQPAQFISLGSAAFNVSNNNNTEAVYRGGVGLRPLGQRLTVAADVIYSGGKFVDAEFNLSTEVIDGIRLQGYYRNESQIAGIGIGINFNHHGIQGFQDLDGSGRYAEPVAAYHYTESKRRTFWGPEEKKRYVKLTIDGPLLENKPTSRFLGPRFPGRTVTGLLLEIRNYAQQENIAGLILDIKNPSGGMAQYQEIRNSLLRFKATGKEIIAYMPTAGNGEYYLASVADNIYLNPAGDLWLTGASVQLMFAKELLNKIGVAAEYIHTGEYKTAGNMFSEDSATAEQLEQLNDYLDDYYYHFTTDIALSRNLTRDSLQTIIDNAPYGAETALELGLVDSLLYEDEIQKLIEGDNPFFSDQFIVEAKNYHDYDDWNYIWEPPILNKIAVIYATGAIVTGSSSRSPFSGQIITGAETMKDAISKARDDKGIKAIVLRIDSPGGSALASDMIWREIHRTVTGKNSKPVIVSMSDIAASGGYYIAAAADSILVNPVTLTGSIGVIAGVISFGDLYEKAGVHVTTLKRGDNADFMNGTDSLTQAEEEKIRELISDKYERFVSRVSEGRGMPEDSIYALAEGKIYSGVDAVKVGLADETGGIAEAIAIAKRASDIPENEKVTLQYLPDYSVGLFDILDNPIISAKQFDFPEEIMKVLSQADQVKLFANEQVLYLLPYTLELENIR